MYHARLKVDKDGQHLDPPEFYSQNHVNSYRNSIKNLYREKKVDIDTDFEGVFKDTMSAYKRRIAHLKAQGAMSMHEGKQPMSQAGYHYLAEAALKQSVPENIFPFFLAVNVLKI